MGVEGWDRLNEPEISDHYVKLNAARTKLHLEIADILREQDIRLAAPVRTSIHGEEAFYALPKIAMQENLNGSTPTPAVYR